MIYVIQRCLIDGNNIVVDPKWFEKYLNNPQLDIKIFGNLDIFSYLYY